MNVSVVIDAVVLSGFSVARPEAVNGAFARELTRLWEVGPPAELASQELARFDAGEVALRADASSHEVGVALARAVLRSLGGAP